ncbi:MAG: UDP-N-acetylmuramate:L-alanyl-gamma-D-glutamyl-meso-diaminopimelate ligase [Legionellaceae bacterium]|nr:UDP-N-acetylmuramate:L-alanyl-gamma-D-glutamyl-meso-diaminopimelate ligase [Legionellaceae bacterium]
MNKRLHFLGIGGTFMSALAILAREAGYAVSGCDANCYPPVSDLLQAKQIPFIEGYHDVAAVLAADVVIVGNAIKRGTPVLEAALNARKTVISGPQWLAENILPKYRVIAVAGTHGKTSTTAMITHILHHCGYEPGFLIGGVSPGMQTSAHLGAGKWFVIEADEYDSAFFDKRPKLMHYRPEVAILHNLEFDHADIYPDLAAIQQQFHYFVRTIPQNGKVLFQRDDTALQSVLQKGVYSQLESMALDTKADWGAVLLKPDGSAFEVWHQGALVGTLCWSIIGAFNVANALSALAACAQTGLPMRDALAALAAFTPVKRRLELRGVIKDVSVYDDFAHHPTAIEQTLRAVKESQRHQRVIAVLEFASYTMRHGVHHARVEDALAVADIVIALQAADYVFTVSKRFHPEHFFVETSTQAILARLDALVAPGDAVIIMSNRGFDDLHQKLLATLSRAEV